MIFSMRINIKITPGALHGNLFPISSFSLQVWHITSGLGLANFFQPMILLQFEHLNSINPLDSWNFPLTVVLILESPGLFLLLVSQKLLLILIFVLIGPLELQCIPLILHTLNNLSSYLTLLSICSASSWSHFMQSRQIQSQSSGLCFILWHSPTSV